MKTKIVIDLEFTGLDNEFIRDNEIVAVHLDGKTTVFSTTKKSTAGAICCHGIDNSNATSPFSKEWREANIPTDAELIGFGVSSDLAMLRKYDIHVSILDVQEEMMLSKHEYRMATEGRSLEACYYIVTGQIPNVSHGDGSECGLIRTIYEKVDRYPTYYLTYMPRGFAAGMEINDYVEQYRRQADGYRFNNSDLLARSLDHAIGDYEDEDDDDDW